MNILTSRHSKVSAVVLGDALDCPVYNPYTGEMYRGSELEGGPHYNMGCAYSPYSTVINPVAFVAICVNKLKTFELLEQNGVLTVPWTQDKAVAQQWLEEDKVIVNRATITGSKNEGVSFSYHGLEGQPDSPLAEGSVLWTRYVNHNRELRVYVFKGKNPLVFEKVRVEGGGWMFEIVRAPSKLLDQMKKAQEAFSGLVFSAYDVLECVTGDYYTLENNSAPSLQVSGRIIPRLKEVIECS